MRIRRSTNFAAAMPTMSAATTPPDTTTGVPAADAGACADPREGPIPPEDGLAELRARE